jgi:hypothetical protein
VSWSIAAIAALAFGTASAGPASADTSSLTVSATTSGSTDQVTLDFVGSVPALSVTEDGNPPEGIGSGRPITIGDSTAYIHLDCPQSCWSGNITNNVPFEQLPLVRGAVTQNFEGELSVDIGLAHQAAYGVSTNGGVITVTIQH